MPNLPDVSDAEYERHAARFLAEAAYSVARLAESMQGNQKQGWLAVKRRLVAEPTRRGYIWMGERP